MELRVWVDGTQRVVCGVKLATTCQEIVFALAHATQQAGRFTMIERWRNNERLLSPNEQPLVTLQRWGEHMNEVEFILRKTSTDLQSLPVQPTHPHLHSQQPLQLQPQPQPQPQQQPQSQQPAVPVKPRVNQLAPVASINSSPNQSIAPVNNAQINHQIHNYSPFNNMYPNNLVRPRQPPGYLDYMQAVTRNSLPQSMSTNTNLAQGNMFTRPYETNSLYDSQKNGVSPVNNHNDRYRYSMNGHLGSTTYDRELANDLANESWSSNSNRPINNSDHAKMVNRNSINNDISQSDQVISAMSKSRDIDAEISLRSNTSEANSSVSKMGHDMLKVIEEQKKVLMNQKSTLDKIDQDEEYWKTKQDTEQKQLIDRIEDEIHQLENLWKDNQSQIKKLENQNLEKELEDLKLDQQKLESEVIKQKNKLSKCESDIALCKIKIEQLEKEVSSQIPPKNRKPIKEIKEDTPFDMAIKVE